METSILGEQLQKEYEQKYPKGPRYTPYLVAFINISEFKGYLGADIDVSKTIRRIEKPLHESFTRHLLKHLDQLNWIAKDKQKIVNGSCDTFDELKSMIVKTINGYPGFTHNSTELSDKPRRDLLMNFLTELQTILASSIVVALKPVKTENDLEDPWSPIHLSLSFALFCRFVNVDFKVNFGKEDWFINTYKRKYILHMSNAATSNEEFLLAIISAYGTDPRKYPSTVLRIMGEKKMLRDKIQAYHLKFPSTVGVDAPKSIVAPGTTARIKPATAVTQASIEQNIFQHNDNLSKLRSHSQNPSSAPPVLMATKSKSNSSNSSNVSSVPSECESTPTPSSVNKNTVTLKKFLEGATDCWKFFYGNETTKQIPLTWYSNFSSQFPFPNKEGVTLNNTVEQLVRDKENITRVGQHKIPYLSDTISSEQFGEIYNELNSSIPKCPSIVVTPTSGVELLMWNNKSQLQHAIIPPLSLEETLRNKSKSVPRPDSWDPSLCVMPFHGFYAHAEWYLNQRKGKESNIKGLYSEIIKLRYVEYLSVLHKQPNQFILGIFTAYGPHVLTYPLRVLQLMKSKDLLCKNTKLFDVIVAAAGKNYSKITPNPDSPATATPKKNGEAEADTAVVNGHVVPSTSSDRMEIDKQNEVKHELDERFPISNSFESWTNACNRTLMENCKGSTVNYEIPESYYRQLYTNYKEVLKNLKEKNSDDENAFYLFALGVWGGICLSDYRKDSISTSGIQSEFEKQSAGTSAGTQTEKIQPLANNTELVGGKDRDIVHVPKYSGQLQLSKTALQTLAKVGFEPDPSVETILTSYASSKKTEHETIEIIQDNFTDDKIHSFVKETACRMCWVSNEDEQKFTADLIKEMIEKKLVSKAYVIHDIKDSMIKHLPDLVVKVVNVTSNVAEFLSYLFKTEDDFCWFIILTTELSQSFIPVWSDLVSKTVTSLKRRTSETAIMALFSRTPGAREFLSEFFKA